MDSDSLLEFSGESPPDDVTLSLLTEEEVLANIENATTTTTMMPSTAVPFSPYSANFYHIGWLSAKIVVALLVVILTAAIKRRDFLKVMMFVFLVPILLECGFDVFTEIKASTTLFGQGAVQWDIYNANISARDFQFEALSVYEDMLAYYTTYNIYHSLSYMPLVCFILASILFWSTLFSSITAFFYAHKAITRPEDITYIHYLWPFVRIQLFPLLMTLVEVLLCLLPVSRQLSFPSSIATAFPRVVAVVAAFVIVAQTFLSLFVFCVSRDEYTKSSPYDQVRNSKWRLFWFIIFQIFVQAMNLPYIAWSGLTLTSDFCEMFDVPLSLPVGVASDAFRAHLSLLPVRPLALLLAAILYLVPYRKRFFRTFCPCCIRQ